jgi:hypothetical protein
METAAIMEGGVAYWLGVEERADERAQLAVCERERRERRAGWLGWHAPRSKIGWVRGLPAIDPRQDKRKEGSAPRI